MDANYNPLTKPSPPIGHMSCLLMMQLSYTQIRNVVLNEMNYSQWYNMMLMNVTMVSMYQKTFLMVVKRTTILYSGNSSKYNLLHQFNSGSY